MDTLLPIIRRARRSLWPDEVVSTAPTAVVAPVETVVESVPVEVAPIVSKVLTTPSVIATDDQGRLTSAATKTRKGNRVSAKSQGKVTDEAPRTQP